MTELAPALAPAPPVTRLRLRAESPRTHTPGSPHSPHSPQSPLRQSQQASTIRAEEKAVPSPRLVLPTLGSSSTLSEIRLAADAVLLSEEFRQYHNDYRLRYSSFVHEVQGKKTDVKEMYVAQHLHWIYCHIAHACWMGENSILYPFHAVDMTILRPDDVTQDILVPLVRAGFIAGWNGVIMKWTGSECIRVTWGSCIPRTTSLGSVPSQSSPRIVQDEMRWNREGSHP